MTNTTEPASRSTANAAAQRVIGLDVGPAGRGFRLLIGITGLVLLYYRIAVLHVSASYLTELAISFVAIVLVYLVACKLLDRFFAKANPWVSAAILLLPISVYSLGKTGTTTPFHNSIALYMSLSLLVNAVIGYGGVEAAAIPAVILGRRHQMYSPFNTVDVGERAFSGGPAGRRVVDLLAGVLTGLVFVLFWFVPLLKYIPPIGGSTVGSAIQLPSWIAVVLLVPTVILALRARGERGNRPAALILLLLTPAFVVMSGQGDGLQGILWGVITMVGIVVGAYQLYRLLFRRQAGQPEQATEQVASG